MEIIKRIEPLENWKLKVVCMPSGWDQEGKTECGSMLEIKKEDILYRKWFKYPDNEGTDYGVICPVCKCFIALNEKLIPNLAKTNAGNYSDYKQTK